MKTNIVAACDTQFLRLGLGCPTKPSWQLTQARKGAANGAGGCGCTLATPGPGLDWALPRFRWGRPQLQQRAYQHIEAVTVLKWPRLLQTASATFWPSSDPWFLSKSPEGAPSRRRFIPCRRRLNLVHGVFSVDPARRQRCRPDTGIVNRALRASRVKLWVAGPNSQDNPSTIHATPETRTKHRKHGQEKKSRQVPKKREKRRRHGGATKQCLKLSTHTPVPETA